MRERDIVKQSGSYWATKTPYGWTVFRDGNTHATSVCTFNRNADGRSLAIAYVEYLGKREAGKA